MAVLRWRYQHKNGWGDVWRATHIDPSTPGFFENPNDWIVEIEPHIYAPDYQAMGDCRVCGHGQDRPWHLFTQSAPAAPTGDIRSGERPPASAAMGHSAGVEPANEMRAALEPFAKAADAMESWADDATPFGTKMFNVGDLRRARAAWLGETTP